jgi:integrase
MAQAYERNGNWWIEYRHRGVHYRVSLVKEGRTNSKREAEKFLAERLTDHNRGKTATLSASKVSFEQMAETFLDDYKTNGRRSIVHAEMAVEHLREFFGSDMAVDITTPRMREYSRLKQEAGYGNATINRHLAALRRMFNLMIEDGVLETAPKFPMLGENNVRKRMLERADFEHLLTFLPDYLKLPIEFGYECGWRKSEVRDLQWSSVALDACELRLLESKNGEMRVIPLTGRRLEIIQEACKQRRLDCPYVFHRNGKHLGDYKKAWQKARKLAGQEGLWVHDLRKSGGTNMSRAGVDKLTIMEIMGHKTDSMFRRYQIRNTEDMVRGFNLLDAYRDRQPTDPKVVKMPTATHSGMGGAGK